MMTNKTPTFGFDCIEAKRKAQARIYEKIKGLSSREEIEYFRRAAETGPFADWWDSLVHRETTPFAAPSRTDTA